MVDCKNLRKNQPDVESPQRCESTTLRYDDAIHDLTMKTPKSGQVGTCAAGFGGVASVMREDCGAPLQLSGCSLLQPCAVPEVELRWQDKSGKT